MFALLFLLPPILISLNAIAPVPATPTPKPKKHQEQQQQQQLQTTYKPPKMSTQLPTNQTDKPPIFLVSASGTTCAEATAQGIRCNSASETNTAQHWIVEHSDSDSDNNDGTGDMTVAFKNARNGEYLSAEDGNVGAQMGTSTRKQFWRLERGTAAGAYWLKCVDFPNAYLKNDWGRHGENNKVLVWKKEEKNKHTSVWYLQAVSATENILSRPAKAPEASEAQQNGDAKARHDSLAAQEHEPEDPEQKQKEAEDAKAQTTEEKEKVSEANEKAAKEQERQFKTLAQKQKQLAEKEQQLADLQQDINWKAAAAKEEDLKELARKRAALKKRERVLFAAETAQSELGGRLEAREKELVRREEELKRRLDDVDAKERGVAAREAGVDRKDMQRTQPPKQKGNSEAGAGDKTTGLVELAGGDENSDASSAVGAKQTAMEKEALKKQVQHLQKRVVGVLKSSASTTKLSPDAKELSRLRNENSRLKDHIVKQSLQEAKLPDKKAEMERLKNDNVRLRTQRDAWKKQASAARPAKEVPSTSTLTSHGGAKRYDCGHVIYPPPRKIEKKCTNFVGYMYED